MNIANVLKRFSVLSGMSSADALRWRSLVDDAADCVNRRRTVAEPDGSQTKRLEMLAAAYAYRSYCMCNDDSPASFKAGEVHYTSPARDLDRAERLWRRAVSESGDIYRADNFLFGRVIT